jgi:hypothetical protein
MSILRPPSQPVSSKNNTNSRLLVFPTKSLKQFNSTRNHNTRQGSKLLLEIGHYLTTGLGERNDLAC